jgi:NTE family protein
MSIKKTSLDDIPSLDKKMEIFEDINLLKKTLKDTLENVDDIINDFDKLSLLIKNSEDILHIIDEIKKNNNDRLTIKNLVLCGGGIKGVVHVGVLKALEDLDYIKNINTFVGVSIGAILATLYVIGYNADSLKQFSLIFPFYKLIDMDIGNIYKFGLDEGHKMITMITEMFIGRNIPINITLNELYNMTKKKIIITAACINDKNPYYFNYENYPNLSVILALRMSMSVPIYFTPVDFDNKLFCDGGCCDNFPIHLIENPKEVLGIYIKNQILNIDKIDSLDIYLIHLIQTILNGALINDKLLKEYENSIVKLHLDVDFMDLELNEKKKIELFELGYNSIINKFKKL